MKKIVLMMVAAFAVMFMITGCSDKAYDFAKQGYQAGKQVVVDNKDKLSPETLDKLKKLDTGATIYNKGRPIGKKVVEYIKEKKEKK